MREEGAWTQGLWGGLLPPCEKTLLSEVLSKQGWTRGVADSEGRGSRAVSEPCSHSLTGQTEQSFIPFKVTHLLLCDQAILEEVLALTDFLA